MRCSVRCPPDHQRLAQKFCSVWRIRHCMGISHRMPASAQVLCSGVCHLAFGQRSAAFKHQPAPCRALRGSPGLSYKDRTSQDRACGFRASGSCITGRPPLCSRRSYGVSLSAAAFGSLTTSLLRAHHRPSLYALAHIAPAAGGARQLGMRCGNWRQRLQKLCPKRARFL